MSKATSPTSGEDIIVSSISKDASDLVEERQIVGRKIWRILPYVTRYWERALGGLLANIGARIFDLIPFIAIGMAADYYNPDNSTILLGSRRSQVPPRRTTRNFSSQPFLSL